MGGAVNLAFYVDVFRGVAQPHVFQLEQGPGGLFDGAAIAVRAQVAGALPGPANVLRGGMRKLGL